MATRLNNSATSSKATTGNFEQALSFMNQTLVWNKNGAEASMKVPPVALKQSDQFGLMADKIYQSGDAAKIAAFEAWYKESLVIQWRPNVKTVVASDALPDFLK